MTVNNPPLSFFRCEGHLNLQYELYEVYAMEVWCVGVIGVDLQLTAIAVQSLSGTMFIRCCGKTNRFTFT